MPTALITLASFAVVTTIALSLLHVVTARSPVKARVRQLLGDTSRRAARPDRPGLIGRGLAGIGQYGFGGDRSLSHRLSVAGFRGPNATALFLGTRTLISVGPG